MNEDPHLYTMEMTPTVAEILAMPEVQRGKPEVIAENGMDRPVRWVHVGDVADLTDFLQGDELVLTTGAALRADPGRYLGTLAAAGGLGAVVEVGEGPPLPATARVVADRLGLVLVTLRRVIRFIDVTERVHRSIISEQYEQVAFARTTHEIFTDLSLRRGSVADIVDAAGRLLESPVVLEDLTHQAVAVTTAGDTTVTVLRDWERRSRLHAAGIGPVGAEGWEVAAVGRGTERWGRLIAIRARSDDRTTMVLERAAQALVIFRMAERGRVDIEHQAQAGLLDDILQGRVRHEDEATARAFALGLAAAAQYTPATVRVGEWPTDADPVDTQRRSSRLLDTVVRAVRASGVTGLFSLRGPGEVGMVLSHVGDPALRTLGDKISRDVRRDDAGRPVLGVAEPAAQLIEAIRRIPEAGQVADAALSMSDGRSYVAIGDVRLLGLIALLRNDPRAQRFAEAELRNLILHDLTGDDLLTVLRSHLELGGNKSAVASALHMSRPSLYAKLARIEQILGVPLDDGLSRTSLHVALLLLDAR